MAINTAYQTARISGMVSGMDTDSIVQNLMKIEQIKLNRELRAKTTLQWKQDALKSVATDMKNFRNTFLTTLGKDAMLSSSVYTTYNVSLSGTKKDAVSITGSSEASMMKVTVNKITQLASGAAASSKGVSAAGLSELSEGNHIKLGELQDKFGNDLFTGTKTVQVAAKEQETLELQVDDGFGGTKTIQGLGFLDTNTNKVVYKDPDSDNYYDSDGNAVTVENTDAEHLPPIMHTKTQPKLNAFGDAMFQDDDGNVYYQVGENSTSGLGKDTYYTLDSEGNPTAAEIGNLNLTPVSEVVYEDQEIADDVIKFKINDVEFEFNTDTTLANMLSAINNSSANVSITYSRLTDGFSITSKETGADASLTIENMRGNAFGENSAFGIGETVIRDTEGNVVKDEDGNATHNAISGQNAVLYINETRVERSSNSFSIDGIRYTLNFTTGSEDLNEDGSVKATQTFNDADAITASLSKNIDSAVDKIKSFIDGYNTMVNKLYLMMNEPKNSSYYALTDEEKAEMTETQIKDWEAMAKSGLLRNDRDIQNVLSNLRMALYETVEGVGLSASDIGLRTSSSRTGEIALNETDLRAALEKDSDAVMRVFMNDGGDNDKANGLLYRFDNILKEYTGTTQYNTNSTLDREMTKLKDKISTMEDRMAKLEEKYYLKYAAMETALSKMQSQTDSISNLLSSMG